MKKLKIKANAKINLTLDVKGVKDGYHILKSLVASIDLFDEITLVSRKDKVINLYASGIPVDCPVYDNNAYRAASAFIKEFDSNGVDIYLKKNIPLASGVGGSSADIAGILNGMKALYGLGVDVLPVANGLGSDSGYMTVGGWAVMEGRGEIITPLDIDREFYVLLVVGEGAVSAKECYGEFDKLGVIPRGCTARAVKALKSGDDIEFYSSLKNDLYKPSRKLVSGMDVAIAKLKEVGALASLMTGSGSAVYGLFESRRALNTAYQKLKPRYGERLIKTKTIK